MTQSGIGLILLSLFGGCVIYFNDSFTPSPPPTGLIVAGVGTALGIVLIVMGTRRK